MYRFYRVNQDWTVEKVYSDRGERTTEGDRGDRTTEGTGHQRMMTGQQRELRECTLEIKVVNSVLICYYLLYQ